MKETEEMLALEHKSVDISTCRADKYDLSTNPNLRDFSCLVFCGVGMSKEGSSEDFHWEGFTYLCILKSLYFLISSFYNEVNWGFQEIGS